MGEQTKSNMPLDESKLSFKIPRTDEPREAWENDYRSCTGKTQRRYGR